MAIYHFSAKVISRANGSSAVAAAAYRSASRLHDERLDRPHDFTNKAGVVHSEILTPQDAPERWRDRGVLWNEVEAGEGRRDAQLAREVEFAIPREMSQADGVALARDFVTREFVDRGMVADLNVHWDVAEDGSPKPHAHVMLTMRQAGADGFGAKVRDWNATALLETWRQAWADHVNRGLAQLDIDVAVDHRSFRDQGLDLEPQNKIGPAASRRDLRGEGLERIAEHHGIARRNGEALLGQPSLALDAITRQQSTFTDHDLMRFVHRHTDGADQFAHVLSAVRASPETVALGRDGAGRERFTTREMLATERRMAQAAQRLAEGRKHRVPEGAQVRAMAAARGRGLALGEAQRDALAHVAGGQDLALVIGYAGTGKSAMLGVAREAWEAQGYQVRGAALSGIAAESLEGGSGIPSRTLASLEHSWTRGRDLLNSRDVLVIDEAGMIGSRQMERILGKAEVAGAKVVLIGDAEQLQAIEAGAAFRALTERHGAAEITEIRRQHDAWQREATRELATGRTDTALGRYEAAGRVHARVDRAAAREALIEDWDAARGIRPGATRLVLAHTRADVAELNQLARARLRAAGELGADHAIVTERGERMFAAGDRLMFLRNERSLGVKNGPLGTVERLEGSRFTVRLDGVGGQQVSFDLKDYCDLDHGYASTIHKSQGVTVDCAHLLATPGLDRHAAYVGMSRHRETLAVHHGADDFKDRAALAQTLGRERAKDTTLDYDAAFAARRGVERSPLRARSRFAGFRPRPAADRTANVRDAAGAPLLGPELANSVNAYARAFAAIEKMRQEALPVLPHQRIALARAEQGLAAVDPDASRDLKSALSRRPGLAGQVGKDGGLAVIGRAMNREGEIRRDPDLRADRFVSDWRRLTKRQIELAPRGDITASRRVEGLLARLARSLEGDAPLRKALAARRVKLGLPRLPTPKLNLGLELVRWIGRGAGPGPER